MDMNDISSYEQLQSNSITGTAVVVAAKNNIEPARYEALYSTATTSSIQAGLAFRTKKINQKLDTLANTLDRIFNFRFMMIDDKILPPVISEGRNTVSQQSDTTLTISNLMYVINKPAKLVQNPPTWRNYLILTNPAKVEAIDASLLPQNEAEKAVWDTFIEKGWKIGVQQADDSFTSGINRLKHEFSGMIRYKVLYAAGLVNKPMGVSANYGNVGGGDTLNVNETVYRITVPSGLIIDKSQWVIDPLSF